MKHLKHMNEAELINPINHKRILIDALETWVFSSRGDPEPYVYYALSRFSRWYELEYGVDLNLPVYREDDEWAAAVIESIRNN